jgi:shikimate kinase
MNIVLVGYRGTGKSTVARLLAAQLQWPWFDADVEIESRAGKSIAQIFASDGEESFRDWESRVVADLCARERCILALGGGAVMRPENREAILRQGRVVWLQASPETLWRRIQSDSSTAERRPDLTAQGGITEIIATLEARREIYRQCAHSEVDTQGKSPEEVANAILAQLNLR